MSDDKPIIEFSVTDVDMVAVEPGAQGSVRVLLCTDHAQDVALILPPKALATLETKLEAVRERQAELGRVH